MTALKTVLISAAALAVAMPALAGDGHSQYKTTTQMQTKTSAPMTDTAMTDTAMTTTANTAVMGSVEMAPSKVNDTVGEILQADGDADREMDSKIIVAGDQQVEDDRFRSIDDDGMIRDNAIVVPGSNNTLTTVTCPAGTEAQVDMTCLITGDYIADIDG